MNYSCFRKQILSVTFFPYSIVTMQNLNNCFISSELNAKPSWNCLLRKTDNSCIISYTMQEIMDSTGMDIYANEPNLEKFLRKLKPTPVRSHEKTPLLISYVCNHKFVMFWLLCCRITCKWVLFLNIDVYLYWLAQIIRKYIRLITTCASAVKTATEVQCLWFTPKTPQLTGQPGVQSDWCKRRTSNTSSCFMIRLMGSVQHQVEAKIKKFKKV